MQLKNDKHQQLLSQLMNAATFPGHLTRLAVEVMTEIENATFTDPQPQAEEQSAQEASPIRAKRVIKRRKR